MKLDSLLLSMKLDKKQPKYKFLEETYGGKWTYCGGFSSRWECDDGRSVQCCCSCYLHEGGWEEYFSQYWLYENGKPPIRVYI